MSRRRAMGNGWLLVVGCGLAWLFGHSTLGTAAEPYVAKGLFKIDTPEGYRWMALRTTDIDGFTLRTYACMKPGSGVRITLAVEEQHLTEDTDRINVLKRHFSTVFRAMKQGGYGGLKGSRPSIEPPIPESVPFVIWGNTPQQRPFYMQSTTLFAERVYVFQVYATSKAEADSFFRTYTSLQELPADSGASMKPIRR